jgi:hypothetical protein
MATTRSGKSVARNTGKSRREVAARFYAEKAEKAQDKRASTTLARVAALKKAIADFDAADAAGDAKAAARAHLRVMRINLEDAEIAVTNAEAALGTTTMTQLGQALATIEEGP